MAADSASVPAGPVAVLDPGRVVAGEDGFVNTTSPQALDRDKKTLVVTGKPPANSSYATMAIRAMHHLGF